MLLKVMIGKGVGVHGDKEGGYATCFLLLISRNNIYNIMDLFLKVDGRLGETKTKGIAVNHNCLACFEMYGQIAEGLYHGA